MHLTRRYLVSFSLMSLMSLVACGGGADDNYQSTELDGAYEAVGEGMSYANLREVIGADPISQVTDGKNVTLFRWEADRGTYLFTTLVLRVHSVDGLLGKSITGPNGSKTENYTGSAQVPA